MVREKFKPHSKERLRSVERQPKVSKNLPMRIALLLSLAIGAGGGAYQLLKKHENTPASSETSTDFKPVKTETTASGTDNAEDKENMRERYQKIIAALLKLHHQQDEKERTSEEVAESIRGLDLRAVNIQESIEAAIAERTAKNDSPMLDTAPDTYEGATVDEATELFLQITDNLHIEQDQNSISAWVDGPNGFEVEMDLSTDEYGQLRLLDAYANPDEYVEDNGWMVRSEDYSSPEEAIAQTASLIIDMQLTGAFDNEMFSRYGYTPEAEEEMERIEEELEQMEEILGDY